MKFIKRRNKFIKENTEAPVREAPTKPAPTKPQPPVKPEAPEEPDWTTTEPDIKPGIKAEKDDQNLAKEVSYTFIAELSKSEESIKKYIS
jgi:hypothetical protein